MLKVLKRSRSPEVTSGSTSFVLDTSRLGQNECLLLNYNQDGNLSSIQKIKTRSVRGSHVGIAETTITPDQHGRVRYQGSSWTAYCDGNRVITAGQQVWITAQHSLHLFVIPLENALIEVL
ncbi:MAG: NfeD family protein [Elainellaceae cyanobacterium]